MSYSKGVNNGTLVFGGLGSGIANTQLSFPIGLLFDAYSNNLIIANAGGCNIVRYTFGATNWQRIVGAINGTCGSTSTLLNSPHDMAFDPMGNLYVADRNNHRIQFFNADQLNGTTIAGITSSVDNNATTLNAPSSVKLDGQLNLYVADRHNHRIQKFLRY